MEVASKLSFKLHCLKCLLNSEHQGDEIYVRYNGAKIWPENRKWHRITEGDEVAMNVNQAVTNVGDKVELELWECDFLSQSKLGNFVFLPDTPGGPFTVDMLAKNGKAKYSLVWEVIKK
jgi:hypothetical protein